MADVYIKHGPPRGDDRSGSSRGDKSARQGSRWPTTAHGPTLKGEKAPQTLDGKGDVVPMYRGWRMPLMYFDWMLRPWAYLDTPVHFVAWYSCAGFYFGAIFFIIGSFASISPAVLDAAVSGNCMSDSYDWLVLFTFMMGNILWQPAVIMQVMEAQNHDYEAKYEEWFLGGKLGKAPRYRYIAFHWWSLEWWGGMNYAIGVVGYNIAAITAVIYDCHEFGVNAYTGLTTDLYIISGIMFFLAGCLYSMAFLNIWLVPTIILPYRKKDCTSLMWWALWLYFWGGVGFCGVGIFYYWQSPNGQQGSHVASTRAYQLVQGIGFGGGSVFFHVGALLLLMRQSRGRCRPSYQQIHQRFDPTGRADPARTEQAHIPEGFTKVEAYDDEYPEKAYKDENKYNQQDV